MRRIAGAYAAPSTESPELVEVRRPEVHPARLIRRMCRRTRASSQLKASRKRQATRADRPSRVLKSRMRGSARPPSGSSDEIEGHVKRAIGEVPLRSSRTRLEAPRGVACQRTPRGARVQSQEESCGKQGLSYSGRTPGRLAFCHTASAWSRRRTGDPVVAVSRGERRVVPGRHQRRLARVVGSPPFSPTGCARQPATGMTALRISRPGARPWRSRAVSREHLK